MIMNRKERYTVITGASRGLGRALAVEAAEKGRNLILAALPGEHIDEIADGLSSKFHIVAMGIEVDLTDEQDLRSFTKVIVENYEVDMLINNAGIGGTNFFESASTAYIDNIIQLNMRALVYLTHQLLPVLKRQKRAYILNIASLAAFGPMPFKTIYPASKAFVASFSKGLNAELRDTNVSVSVAYPGGMATNPEIIARLRNYNKLIRSTFLSPRTTARICFRQTLAGNTVIVPGFANKINRFLIKLIPEQIRLIIFSRNLQMEMTVKLA